MRKRKEKETRPLQLIGRKNIEKSKTEKEKKQTIRSDIRAITGQSRGTSGHHHPAAAAAQPYSTIFRIRTKPKIYFPHFLLKLIKTLYMCRRKCDLSAVIFAGSKEIREISHANGQRREFRGSRACWTVKSLRSGLFAAVSRPMEGKNKIK